MTKEKRSFLERLTGSKNIEEKSGNSMPIFTDEEEGETNLGNLGKLSAVSQNQNPNSTSQKGNSIPITEETESDTEGQLTIDVFQTEGEIVIKSTIAGVKPEDLDVSINNDMITIHGERKIEEEIKEDDYYYQECYWGSFSRSVVLPVDIIPEKAEASLKNGILTIRLPKAETNKIRKIQVRGF